METTASFADRCRAFGDLGIDHVTVVTTGPWTTDAIATGVQTARRSAHG